MSSLQDVDEPKEHSVALYFEHQTQKMGVPGALKDSRDPVMICSSTFAQSTGMCSDVIAQRLMNGI